MLSRSLGDPSPSLVFSSLFPPANAPPRYTRKIYVHHANQQSSPLLRLPPEIRLLIWTHLLLMSPIHLTWSNGKGLTRCSHCSRLQPPNSTGSPRPHLQNDRGDHPPCFLGLYPLAASPAIPKHSPTSPRQSLRTKQPLPPLPPPLSFLLVSRHLHAEISSLILSTSPILIDSPYAFYAFFKHLPATQRPQLASLHLLCESSILEPPVWNQTRLSWNRVLHPTLLAQLTGLQRLEISIVTQRSFVNMRDVLVNKATTLGTNVMHARKSRGFLRFRACPGLKIMHPEDEGGVTARIMVLGGGSHAVWVMRTVELGDLRGKIAGVAGVEKREEDEARRWTEGGEGLAAMKAARRMSEPRAKPGRNVWKV